MNELALKDQKPKVEKVIPIGRGRDVKNPVDEEISKLREQGLEVPRELLNQKHAFNKARHAKDVKR